MVDKASTVLYYHIVMLTLYHTKALELHDADRTVREGNDMKKVLSMILAVTMILSFAACGSNAAQTTETQPAGTEAQAAGKEVVFNFPVNYEETNWDPAYWTAPDDTGLGTMIYENLFRFNLDGSVSPQLATSYEISEDKLTYTIKLRNDVKWQKGYGPFTSADVKFTIDRQTDPALASINGANFNIENIESVECPDDFTVVIKLKAIDVDFLTRLSMFYSLIVCKAYNDKEGMAALNAAPVGTGAFQFDKGTLAVKTEAVANKDWWGDREGGNIDRVICSYIADENTGFTAFENGELDVITSSNLDKTRELVAKGFVDQQSPKLSLLYIGMNMQMAPFDNEKVREALFYAVDPQYYIDNLFYGTETIPESYIPEGSKYAAKGCFRPSYDPEKAKALLAEAGYPDGVDIELWGGNDAHGQAPVIIAADMLQKGGFNVSIQLVDFGIYIDKVRKGEVMTWCFYNTTSNIADDTISRYKSEFYPGNNWSGVCDAEYDSYVDAGFSSKTDEEKAQNFAAAQQRLMDLKAIYPVTTCSTHMLCQPGLQGYKIYGDLAFRATTIIK